MGRTKLVAISPFQAATAKDSFPPMGSKKRKAEALPPAPAVISPDSNSETGTQKDWRDVSLKSHCSSTQKHSHERQRQAYIDNMHNFWQKQLDKIKNTDFKNLKQHDLPLARIKKIMRSDEDVKMISAEAPVLFAKACELFILDLTMRAWSHADSNRRRTLQREDVAKAVADSETFDFLLDVVPRQPPDHNKDTNKDKVPDANSVAEMAKNPLDSDIAQSDHRLRRPMLNPLNPAAASLDMIMPVPVESKVQGSAQQIPVNTATMGRNDPIFTGASGSREWPQSSVNNSNLLLGPATSQPSLVNTGSPANLSMNLRLTDPTNRDGHTPRPN